ncbi:GNL3L/Grn1 putative GTPase-domain-containing protein [Absidia repens]|uniref:GNL3L/Grn1 putative GTPase-domain-containing protein n=1 Tax=Absidia repens TaxID=90262 RepID=A0A1X2INY3_9FUNG|nr:GNL3L/Grn1 putative GTPase-domain-containing protein [Absidia repens]
MVPKKYKSKRGTAREYYKIEKRVREHHRKLRKEQKKNPQLRRKPKDPGIPNNWPFKEELLNEVERHKQDLEEEKKKQRAARLAQSEKDKKNKTFQKKPKESKA